MSFMRALLLTISTVLLLTANCLSLSAQPEPQIDKALLEEMERIERDVEEYLKEHPIELICEYSSTKSSCDKLTDLYYDSSWHRIYATNGDRLWFGKVSSATFKATYFSVFSSNGRCLNCESDIQTLRDWKSLDWIKDYVIRRYASQDWKRIHVKYFIQAKVTNFIKKGTSVVYLTNQYYAELWSEANYDRDWGWVSKYGYPDEPYGGRDKILNKAVYVSVGCPYHKQFPTYHCRSFGHPDVITLCSNFLHQFLILSSSYSVSVRGG